MPPKRNDEPITVHFKYHLIQVEDPKTFALKTFRCACATTLPWHYGLERQDYTPEMLCWDSMQQGNNNNETMASLCAFDVSEYENQMSESSLTHAYASNLIKTFKYHIHFVEDQKLNVQKKFFVASITSLPRMYGSPDQHYTPDMLRWDEMQMQQNGNINQKDTMAALCNISQEEVEQTAHQSQEQTAENLFKHNTIEVEDSKVGLKKFFVASITTTPDLYGQENQHYTPDMFHWDILRQENPQLRDDSQSMAFLCGTELENFS